MPGEKAVSRGGARRLVRVAVVLAASAVLWGASRGIVDANRFRLSPPTRSLPMQEEQAAFEHGVSPEDVRRLLAEGASEGTTPAGTRLFLTLDERLQRDVFELFRRFDPPYGAFAAIEPGSGRVVALVGYRKGGEPDPWLPLKAIYPAASLVKVVTAAAALEKGEISPDEEIAYRGGIYRITPRNIHAKAGRGSASMSLQEAIARSANSVFGTVAVKYVGGEMLEEYLGKFGFEQRIPFGLPVEVSHGEVPRDEYNLARTGAGFGEIYVSPLHMAMIMAAIGGSGEMPRPILIERVEGSEEEEALYEAEPSKWRDTVSPETADALLRMMVKTIEIGTSRRTFGSPVSTPLLRDMEVAGKTGSLSGWVPRMRFEWFAGVAPVSGPKLAVAALVVNGSHWRIKGSYVGKEAFSTYFGYPHSTPPSYRKARTAKARGKKRSVSKKRRHRTRRAAGPSRVKGARPSRGASAASARRARR